MGQMLVITDDTARSVGLAEDIAAGAPFQLFDIYDAAVPAGPATALIADVLDLRSDTIAHLRRFLSRTRIHAPLIVLLHNDNPRGRLLALALGATQIHCPPFDTVRLRASLAGPDPLPDTQPLSPLALQVTCQARDFFVTVFMPDRLIVPSVINTGSSFIGQAVRDTGIRDWVWAVRRFDDATHQHCLLVAGLAAAFAQALGVGDLEAHRLTKAALLHDVGKIQVPTAILNKPGKLDYNEMMVMKQHPERGYTMLSGQGFHPEVLQVIRSHHEMLDGSGYPDKLKEAEIPDLVRVVTVCDIYAALIERRPYKPPMPSEQAFAILESMTGRLDATIVEAFRPVAAAFTPRFSPTQPSAAGVTTSR